MRLAELGDPLADDELVIARTVRSRADVAAVIVLLLAAGLGVGAWTVLASIREATRPDGVVTEFAEGVGVAAEALVAPLATVLEYGDGPTMAPGYRIVGVDLVGGDATGAALVSVLTVEGTVLDAPPDACAGGTTPTGLVYRVVVATGQVESVTPLCGVRGP